MTGDDEALLPAHPAFIGVRRLRFELDERTVAGDAQAWLEWLRGEEVDAAWLEAHADGATVRTGVRNGVLAWLMDVQGGRAAGRRNSGVTRPPRDASDAARDFSAAIERALHSEPEAMRREPLARAQLILASPHDGEEVSDTAWPHFILPAREVAPRRRLLAAAATVLPQDGVGGAADARDDGLQRAALEALCAAVNGD